MGLLIFDGDVDILVEQRGQLSQLLDGLLLLEGDVGEFVSVRLVVLSAGVGGGLLALVHCLSICKYCYESG